MSDLIELRWLNEQLLQLRALMLMHLEPSTPWDAHVTALRVEAQLFRSGEGAPSARLSLPTRCAGVPDEKCVLQDEDARVSTATFTNPSAWRCRGCDFRSDGTTT